MINLKGLILFLFIVHLISFLKNKRTFSIVAFSRFCLYNGRCSTHKSLTLMTSHKFTSTALKIYSILKPFNIFNCKKLFYTRNVDIENKKYILASYVYTKLYRFAIKRDRFAFFSLSLSRSLFLPYLCDIYLYNICCVGCVHCAFHKAIVMIYFFLS